MAYIYNGSRLCTGLGSGVQATASGDLSLRAPNDTSDIRLLLLGTYHYAPHTTLQIYHHYKYDIIPVSISFPHPIVSWVFLLYIWIAKDNIHKCIQHNHDYPTTRINMSIISGVTLFQGLRIQEFRSTGDTGVQEYRRYRSTRCLVKI